MPSHPGKEFEIQKRLDRLKGKNSNFKRNKNNNNNNFGSSGPNIFDFGAPPSLPTLEDFIDGGPRPPLPPQPPTVRLYSKDKVKIIRLFLHLLLI